MSPAAIAIVLLIIIVASVGTVYAVYKITSPPSLPVTVNTIATLSAPNVNGTVLVVGDTLQLSSTLSDAALGVQVFFYETGSTTPLGSALTNSNGEAILNVLMSQPKSTVTYYADAIHP